MVERRHERAKRDTMPVMVAPLPVDGEVDESPTPPRQERRLELQGIIEGPGTIDDKLDRIYRFLDRAEIAGDQGRAATDVALGELRKEIAEHRKEISRLVIQHGDQQRELLEGARLHGELLTRMATAETKATERHSEVMGALKGLGLGRYRGEPE